MNTSMSRIDVSLPELAFVAATRGMAGAGIGLLLAGFLNGERRKAIGWTLLAIGALTTVPIAIDVITRRRSPQPLPETHRPLEF